MQQLVQQLRDRVVQWYSVPRAQVHVVFAPYRICPLGAHIDHQLGNVTAMALDHGVLLAFAPMSQPEVRLRSLDFEGEAQVQFADVPGPQKDDWGNYVRGAVQAMQQEFTLHCGFVGATAGRVSEGGLSSSAAVGVAYLLALQYANELLVSPEKNIALVQQIENHYLGLRIGILDQSAILLSQQNALTLIDCQHVTHQLIARPTSLPAFDILIAFSGLRKSLVGTDYNRRVGECQEAARLLLEAAGRESTPAKLRFVTPEEYQQFGDHLTGAPARRAAHFFAEMERVRRGTEAWRRGDLTEFGQLITESGASSIHNYQCGAPPLIDLYDTLLAASGVYGARFSGAGFRGCCLALVDPRHTAATAEQVQKAYAQQHPELAADAWTMICHAGDGARML